MATLSRKMLAHMIVTAVAAETDELDVAQLATSLGGRLPVALVNTLFARGLEDALVRDACAQRALFPAP